MTMAMRTVMITGITIMPTTTVTTNTTISTTEG
jgi:hypothetical protein